MKRRVSVVCFLVILLVGCFAAELRMEHRKPLTANVGIETVVTEGAMR